MEISEFTEMADGYDPCDPNSQPSRELRDYIMEPVDQWLLDHGAVDSHVVEDAMAVWQELGTPVLDEDTIPVDVQEELDHLDPDTIRKVQPAVVKDYAERLKPMVFESLGLAAIRLDLLARVENDPVIIGQMFGVPRDDAFVPVLILETTIAGGMDHALSQMHGFFHLLNDCYSENPEEIQVML